MSARCLKVNSCPIPPQYSVTGDGGSIVGFGVSSTKRTPIDEFHPSLWAAPALLLLVMIFPFRNAHVYPKGGPFSRSRGHRKRKNPRGGTFQWVRNLVAVLYLCNTLTHGIRFTQRRHE